MPRTKSEMPIERLAAMSQAEVAAAIGVSIVRVSQLERSALKKIRAEFERRGVHGLPERESKMDVNQCVYQFFRQWEYDHVIPAKYVG